MDVIPLDAGLVKGSHGRRCEEPLYRPVLIADSNFLKEINTTDVYSIIWNNLSQEL
jgi:hypothetical protein